MTVNNASEISSEQAQTIVEDIVASAIEAPGDLDVIALLELMAPGNSQPLHALIQMCATAGFTAGHASKTPADDRTILLAKALRATHQREAFGDCTEDGTHFPCKTIRAVNIVVGVDGDDTSVLGADDIVS